MATQEIVRSGLLRNMSEHIRSAVSTTQTGIERVGKISREFVIKYGVRAAFLVLLGTSLIFAPQQSLPSFAQPPSADRNPALAPLPAPTENPGRPQDKYHIAPTPARGIPFHDSLGNSGYSQFAKDTDGQWVPLGGPLANNGVTYCAGDKCVTPTPKPDSAKSDKPTK